MRKIISFMHISLDGFVAGPNGEMNWIKIDQEMFDYVGKRISEGDTALYGRLTYQMMESYWPNAGKSPTATNHEINHAKWYNSVHKVVLSKTLEEASLVNTEVISDDISERIKALKEQPGSDILLFGSPTATHSLLDLNLIDGFWLFVNPIVLGRGIPLFVGGKDKEPLKLLHTHQFTSGVVELSYVVERGAL